MNSKPQMNADERRLVPRLRFPEFVGTGEWKDIQLKWACCINPSSGDLPDMFTYIDLESVVSGEVYFKNAIRKEDAPSRAQRLLRNGDVIYQMVRPYQKNNLLCNFPNEKKYVASTGYAQLRANEESQFLFQIIHTDDFVDRVLSKCTGSNYPAIRASDLADIKIAYPKQKEQQKIAECLSTLDEVIRAEGEKLATLKLHKKGLMQQLFPAEGKTTPKLRFSEFDEDGEWVEKMLDQLATYTKGFAFKSKDYRGEGIRIIRVSDLGADFIKPSNEKIFISSESAGNYKKYKLNKADIIITTVGSKPELVNSAVGRGIFVCSSNEGLLNQNLLKLEVMTEVNSIFLFSNINTKPYQQFIASISRGNANQANIAVKELMKFELKVPSPPEQQQIADCLSSLDDLITARSQKITTLKLHKKGLMQQLFPSSEEIRQ